LLACLLASFRNASRSREANLCRGKQEVCTVQYGKTPECICESVFKLAIKLDINLAVVLVCLVLWAASAWTFPKPRDNVETAGKTLRSCGRTSSQPREDGVEFRI
jgi:hypothetical protein